MDQTFYKKPVVDSLAISLYFDYNIFTHYGHNNQLNHLTFGDFDKDSITEAIFYVDSPQTIHLIKFNKNLLTFDSLLTYPTVGNEYVVGFTVGDFDIDGKTDIIYASEYGNIYVLENEGTDKYSISWQGNSSIWNSHINFKTNDIDGNGKPEFWIGEKIFPRV
jgi:FG-GAP-like repeat